MDYKDSEPTHGTNPYCSASPATDGKNVVVSYGSAGVACYDFEGNLQWHRDLGKCIHIWGNAASPVLYENLVFLNFGPGERTFLIALDKKTGEDVWKMDEPGGKTGFAGSSEWIGSWSTPIITKVSGRDELVMSWPGGVKAYTPKTGEILWSCIGSEYDKSLGRFVYTSPLASEQAIVAMSGYGGPYIAIKPGGSGDVTKTHRLWRVPSGPQRIGSGVIIGDHIFMVNEQGTAQCIELKTGKTLWTQRVTTPTWGSLVHAGDRLYITSMEGETVIMAAKPKLEVIAQNHLKERTLASIAVSEGEIFIRTYKNLWCIGKK